MSKDAGTKKEVKWAETCESIMKALYAMDGGKLRAHTAFMRERNPEFQVSKIIPLNVGERSTWDNNVKLMAHPLCVLLERVKLCTIESSAGRASDAVGVVVRDWDIDPNMVFTAKESRPRHTLRAFNPGDVLLKMTGSFPAERFAVYTIKSTPLSWLVHLRHGDRRGEVNAMAGMRRLLELRADPNLPFHLVARGPLAATAGGRKHDVEASARNGHSLLSVAMESGWGVECVEMLLASGARFREADPQPLCAAIAVYGADVAVPLFHRYWRTGQIAPRDVLPQDVEDGDTPMHLLAMYPPLCDAATMASITDMMFEMGFTPHTKNRNGATVLQCAETPQQFLTAERRESRKTLVNELHARDRTMAMAAHWVLQQMPLDVRGHIARLIPYGSKLQWAAEADERRREKAGV